MAKKSDRKDKNVSFRMTEAEYMRLAYVANECGITVTKLLYDLTEGNVLEAYMQYNKKVKNETPIFYGSDTPPMAIQEIETGKIICYPPTKDGMMKRKALLDAGTHIPTPGAKPIPPEWEKLLDEGGTE